MRERGYLVPQGRGRGTGYRLAPKLSDLLHGLDRGQAGLPLDAGAARSLIQATLAEQRRLTNAEVRSLLGYSRAEALRLMRNLLDEGVVELQGQGRGAHYVPAARVGQAAGGKARRKK